MIFHYLAFDEGLQYIRPSAEARTSRIVTPRISHDCPGSMRIPAGFACAMLQCILATLRRGKLHIYTINAASFTEPIITAGNFKRFRFYGAAMGDDKDVTACGRIELTYQGFIELTDELEWKLRQLVERHKLLPALL